MSSIVLFARKHFYLLALVLFAKLVSLGLSLMPVLELLNGITVYGNLEHDNTSPVET